MTDPVENTWEPVTRLGHMVLNEEITSMEDALNSGLPLILNACANNMKTDTSHQQMMIYST